ncbi:MAG: hypothetical protein ACLGH7_01545, partial [Actinomycetes bacterium]
MENLPAVLESHRQERVIRNLDAFLRPDDQEAAPAVPGKFAGYYGEPGRNGGGKSDPGEEPGGKRQALRCAMDQDER